MRSATDRGFTLVEMLVTIVVVALFMVGILQLLDTSSDLSRRESALSDAQENVRYGTYSLVRIARMVGGGGLPFVIQGTGGAGVWVGGQILTQQSGTVSVDLNAVSIDVKAQSDVVVLRGFFEQSPFFVSRTDVNVSSSQVTITESPGATLRNPMDLIPATGAFADRLVAFLGRGEQYAIGKVTNAGGTVADSGGPEGDILTLPFEEAGTGFHTLNADPTMSLAATLGGIEVYRVAILESYVYYVDPDDNLRRVRNEPGSPADEVLAIDIGNLQAALGLDTSDPPDGLVDTWMANPTIAAVVAAQPVALRLTVLGRTPFPVSNWTEPPATFAVEDLPLAAVDRSAKWRRMQVIAALRNFIL